MARNTPSDSSNDNINIESNKNSSNDSSNGSGNNSNSRLCCFGYVDYIILASTLAVALGEELSSTDLEILASFFAVLSDELALVSAVQECTSESDNDVVVTPVPSVVAMTRANKNMYIPKKKRTRVKKIIKKKVKKK